MRSAWLLATALLLAGCATTTTPSSSATPVPPSRIFARDYTRPGEGLALLVVTRDAGVMLSKACATDLFIDGVKVADIEPTEQVRLFVEEGEHLVGVIARGSVCLAKSSQITVNVTRAKPFLLRIRSSNGFGIVIEQSAF